MKHTMNKNRACRAVAAALLAILLAACQDRDAASKAESRAEAGTGEKGGEKGLTLTPQEQQQAGLKVESIAPRSYPDFVSVTATIRPNADRIAQIAPRVEARIARVMVDLGDKVRAGQPLAALDSVEIGQAQASLLQAQSAHRVAQADYERAQSLAAQEIIPQKDLLRARGDLEKSGAEVRAAQMKLQLLGAGPARSGSPTLVLTAPFAGSVIQKRATVGELASPSQPAFTVADLSRVWVEANLTEDVLSKVRTGAVAEVTVGAYPGERFAGRVTYIGGVLEKESRTVPARIEVANADGRLKPEMFANATISTSDQRQLLTLPDEAVVLMQGQPTVFVAEGAGFAQRPVELDGRVGGRTVVKSGLKAGDRVVAAGAYALKARVLKSQIGDTH